MEQVKEIIVTLQECGNLLKSQGAQNIYSNSKVNNTTSSSTQHTVNTHGNLTEKVKHGEMLNSNNKSIKEIVMLYVNKLVELESLITEQEIFYYSNRCIFNGVSSNTDSTTTQEVSSTKSTSTEDEQIKIEMAKIELVMQIVALASNHALNGIWTTMMRDSWVQLLSTLLSSLLWTEHQESNESEFNFSLTVTRKERPTLFSLLAPLVYNLWNNIQTLLVKIGEGNIINSSNNKEEKTNNKNSEEVVIHDANAAISAYKLLEVLLPFSSFQVDVISLKSSLPFHLQHVDVDVKLAALHFLPSLLLLLKTKHKDMLKTRKVGNALATTPETASTATVSNNNYKNEMNVLSNEIIKLLIKYGVEASDAIMQRAGVLALRTCIECGLSLFASAETVNNTVGEGNKSISGINSITSMITKLVERAVFIDSNDVDLQRDLGAVLGYYLSLLQIDVNVNNVMDLSSVQVDLHNTFQFFCSSTNALQSWNVIELLFVQPMMNKSLQSVLSHALSTLLSCTVRIDNLNRAINVMLLLLISPHVGQSKATNNTLSNKKKDAGIEGQNVNDRKEQLENVQSSRERTLRWSFMPHLLTVAFRLWIQTIPSHCVRLMIAEILLTYLNKPNESTMVLFVVLEIMKDVFHSMTTSSQSKFDSVNYYNSNQEVCKMNCCSENLYSTFMPTIDRLVKTHKTTFYSISVNVLTAFLSLCDNVHLESVLLELVDMAGNLNQITEMTIGFLVKSNAMLATLESKLFSLEKAVKHEIHHEHSTSFVNLINSFISITSIAHVITLIDVLALDEPPMAQLDACEFVRIEYVLHFSRLLNHLSKIEHYYYFIEEENNKKCKEVKPHVLSSALRTQLSRRADTYIRLLVNSHHNESNFNNNTVCSYEGNKNCSFTMDVCIHEIPRTCSLRAAIAACKYVISQPHQQHIISITEQTLLINLLEGHLLDLNNELASKEQLHLVHSTLIFTLKSEVYSALLQRMAQCKKKQELIIKLKQQHLEEEKHHEKEYEVVKENNVQFSHSRRDDGSMRWILSQAMKDVEVLMTLGNVALIPHEPTKEYLEEYISNEENNEHKDKTTLSDWLHSCLHTNHYQNNNNNVMDFSAVAQRHIRATMCGLAVELVAQGLIWYNKQEYEFNKQKKNNNSTEVKDHYRFMTSMLKRINDVYSRRVPASFASNASSTTFNLFAENENRHTQVSNNNINNNNCNTASTSSVAKRNVLNVIINAETLSIIRWNALYLIASLLKQLMQLSCCYTKNYTNNINKHPVHKKKATSSEEEEEKECKIWMELLHFPSTPVHHHVQENECMLHIWRHWAESALIEEVSHEIKVLASHVMSYCLNVLVYMRRLSIECNMISISIKEDNVVDRFTSHTLMRYATLKLTRIQNNNNNIISTTNAGNSNVNMLILNGSDNNDEGNNNLYSLWDNMTVSLIQAMCTIHCSYMECWHEPSKTLPLVISFLMNTLTRNMCIEKFTWASNHTNKQKKVSTTTSNNNSKSVVSSYIVTSMALNGAIQLITHYYTMCYHTVQNKQIEALVNTLVHCALLNSFDETLYSLITSSKKTSHATFNEMLMLPLFITSLPSQWMWNEQVSKMCNINFDIHTSILAFASWMENVHEPPQKECEAGKEPGMEIIQKSSNEDDNDNDNGDYLQWISEMIIRHLLYKYNMCHVIGRDDSNRQERCTRIKEFVDWYFIQSHVEKSITQEEQLEENNGKKENDAITSTPVCSRKYLTRQLKHYVQYQLEKKESEENDKWLHSFVINDHKTNSSSISDNFSEHEMCVTSVIPQPFTLIQTCMELLEKLYLKPSLQGNILKEQEYQWYEKFVNSCDAWIILECHKLVESNNQLSIWNTIVKEIISHVSNTTVVEVWLPYIKHIIFASRTEDVLYELLLTSSKRQNETVLPTDSNNIINDKQLEHEMSNEMAIHSSLEENINGRFNEGEREDEANSSMAKRILKSNSNISNYSSKSSIFKAKKKQTHQEQKEQEHGKSFIVNKKWYVQVESSTTLEKIAMIHVLIDILKHSLEKVQCLAFKTEHEEEIIDNNERNEEINITTLWSSITEIIVALLPLTETLHELMLPSLELLRVVLETEVVSTRCKHIIEKETDSDSSNNSKKKIMNEINTKLRVCAKWQLRNWKTQLMSGVRVLLHSLCSSHHNYSVFMESSVLQLIQQLLASATFSTLVDDITIRRLVQSTLVVLLVHDRRANIETTNNNTYDNDSRSVLLCNTSIVSNTSSTNMTTSPTSNYKENNMIDWNNSETFLPIDLVLLLARIFDLSSNHAHDWKETHKMCATIFTKSAPSRSTFFIQFILVHFAKYVSMMIATTLSLTHNTITAVENDNVTKLEIKENNEEISKHNEDNNDLSSINTNSYFESIDLDDMLNNEQDELVAHHLYFLRIMSECKPHLRNFLRNNPFNENLEIDQYNEVMYSRLILFFKSILYIESAKETEEHVQDSGDITQNKKKEELNSSVEHESISTRVQLKRQSRLGLSLRYESAKLAILLLSLENVPNELINSIAHVIHTFGDEQQLKICTLVVNKIIEQVQTYKVNSGKVNLSNNQLGSKEQEKNKMENKDEVVTYINKSSKTEVDELLEVIVNSTINLHFTSIKEMVHLIMMKECGIAEHIQECNTDMFNLSIKETILLLIVALRSACQLIVIDTLLQHIPVEYLLHEYIASKSHMHEKPHSLYNLLIQSFKAFIIENNKDYCTESSVQNEDNNVHVDYLSSKTMSSLNSSSSNFTRFVLLQHNQIECITCECSTNDLIKPLTQLINVLPVSYWPVTLEYMWSSLNWLNLNKYMLFMCIVMNQNDVKIEVSDSNTENERYSIELHSLFVISSTRQLLTLFISACNSNEVLNDEEVKQKLLTFCIRVILHQCQIQSHLPSKAAAVINALNNVRVYLLQQIVPHCSIMLKHIITHRLNSNEAQQLRSFMQESVQ